MDENFVKGPNPLEAPDIGRDLVPFFQRFYPGDEKRFWMLDTIHSPEPLYPLEYETSYFALAEYADGVGTEINKVPTSHANAFRVLNGWCYFSPVDITNAEEIGARAETYVKKVADVYPRWDQWLEETETRHMQAAEWLASWDFETDPDLGDAAQTYSLVERFDAVLAALCNSGAQHLENLVLVTGQKFAFTAICREIDPSTTDAQVDTMVQGFGNKLMETDAAFWKLGKRAMDLGIVGLIDGAGEHPSAALAKDATGARWLEEVKQVVDEYGVRHVGGCYNLMPVCWQEDLDYPISFIRGSISKIEKGEELVPVDELVAVREAAIKEFVAKIQSEEQKKNFYDNLRLLQQLYPWYENHNFLYEGLIGTRVHIKMIELGRRLVKEGYFDDPYDIGYFLLHELRQLLFGLMHKRIEFSKDNLVDFRPMIEERKKIREKQKSWHAPVVLGLKPTSPPENPIAVYVYGALPSVIDRSFTDDAQWEEVVEITGLGAAPGVAEGVARVVRDPSALKAVQSGEILVAGSTNPMWNPVLAKVKGVVTDSGGLLAHAAVICREYGLPAVVGTAKATQAIKTGDYVTVDGTTGVVTIKRK
ncbi:MAG: hypothetical protein GXX83_07470 [Gaiellales bacterium]|nr:hypothetical protein [Gaiellales bacterium]